VLLLEKKNILDKNTFLLTNEETLTYEEVFFIGDQLFSDQKKEVVLILCDKDVDTIAAYVGALRNNKVPLLVDKNYRIELIKSFIDNYAPSYIVGGQDIAFSEPGYNVALRIRSSVVYKRATSVKVEIDDELALLIPTSGSTGDPKCVRLSFNNVDSCTQSICEYLDFDQNRVSASFLPIHYSYGLSVLHNCIYKRAKYTLSKLTILDKEIWDEVEKFQITDFSGVPFTMKILVRMKLDYDKISSLKYITQAGGYFPEKDATRLFEEFSAHDIQYFTMYGQTEASPRISYLAPEHAVAKAGTAGVPISCGKAYIADTGESSGTGELCYKGPNVALGYAKNYQDLNLGDEFNGTLLTGDIVEIDSDGFIKIVGRNKRFIKIAGISANLDKIEKDLNEVYSSIVVVGKDDKLIVLSENEDIENIKQFFISKYNFNKTNIKVKNIEEIPLNASGKTDYKLLTETYC
jgi:long-chain acyl-CoA synthetase